MSDDDEKKLAALDCQPWTGALNSDGYPSGREHRRAWEKANGRRLKAHEVVRHNCDNRACVEPTHLLIGTHADNRRDCVERGRQAKGEGNGRAVLTEEGVRHIRRSVLSNSDMAQQFGVDRSTIRAIRQGKTWRHVA